MGMPVMEQIVKDLTQAMRGKDEVTKGVLRGVKAAVQYRRLEKGTELSEDEVRQVIQKEVKQRRDAQDTVPADRRDKYRDYLERQEREIEVLERYVPQQLDEAELDVLVGRILDEHGITAKSQMSEAMGLVMPQVKGKADGRRVNRLVARRLK